jgi:hypothetical protein
MVLSETIQYVTILGVTVFFSAFSFADTEHRLVIKIVSGLCWFVMALTQFYYFGVTQVFAVPFMFLFLGLGTIFCFSIVTDFRQKKRDEIWNFE